MRITIRGIIVRTRVLIPHEHQNAKKICVRFKNNFSNPDLTRTVFCDTAAAPLAAYWPMSR